MIKVTSILPHSFTKTVKLGETAREFGKEEMFDFFTIPGQNVSLIDIGTMYSVKDFHLLLNNLYSPPTFIEPEPCVPSYDLFGYDCPEIVETIRQSQFQVCIESFINRTGKIDTEDLTKRYNTEAAIRHISILSPCHSLERYPECSGYCSWHENYFKNVDKSEFLSMMAFSQPQRKLNYSLKAHKNIAGK